MRQARSPLALPLTGREPDECDALTTHLQALGKHRLTGHQWHGYRECGGLRRHALDGRGYRPVEIEANVADDPHEGREVRAPRPGRARGRRTGVWLAREIERTRDQSSGGDARGVPARGVDREGARREWKGEGKVVAERAPNDPNRVRSAPERDPQRIIGLTCDRERRGAVHRQRLDPPVISRGGHRQRERRQRTRLELDADRVTREVNLRPHDLRACRSTRRRLGEALAQLVEQRRIGGRLRARRVRSGENAREQQSGRSAPPRQELPEGRPWAEARARQCDEEQRQQGHARYAPYRHRHGAEHDEAHGLVRLDGTRPPERMRSIVPGRNPRPRLDERAGRVARDHLRRSHRPVCGDLE